MLKSVRCSPLLCCLVAAFLALPAVPALAQTARTMTGTAAEEQGDQAFAQRARGGAGSADQQVVDDAIEAYERALEQDEANLSLRVKLLHALFFKAEYASQGLEEQKVLYARGRDLFEKSYELLANKAGRDTLRGVPVKQLGSLIGRFDEAGPLYFWGAMHWGLWAESFGKVAAVRQGVIKKVRELSEGALALAPQYENYGPFRVLGRLHHLTPKIPILTGWVDRKRAVLLLRRSVDSAPDEPLNQTFLAHALWQLTGDHRGALEILRGVIVRRPRDTHKVEDRKAIDGARELIARVEQDAARRKVRTFAPAAHRAAGRG